MNVLKHRFTSPKLDGPDLTQVQPSAWNDGHQFSGGLHGDVLTRDTSDATFGASWQTPAPPVGWVAYTPGWWLGATLVVAVTDHVFLAANYHREGNAVWFHLFFQVGSNPLVGGLWQFGLPFPSTALVSSGGGLLRSSAGGLYPLWLSSVGFSDRVALQYLPAAQPLGDVTWTTPVAMTAGLLIEVRGNYTAA